MRLCMMLAYTALWAVSIISPISAATYRYIGKPDLGSGNYLTAVVDLDCTTPCGAGIFSPFEPNPGVKSFSLSAYSGSDVLLATVSSSDQMFLGGAFPVFELNFDLTLDESGHVTNWSLYRYGRTAAGDDLAIITLGLALPGLATSDTPLVSGEFVYLNGTILLNWHSDALNDLPLGEWTYAASSGGSVQTPLPAAFPLFASIVAVVGLSAWRRRRRSAERGGSDRSQ